jgi:hypothetical protein
VSETRSSCRFEVLFLIINKFSFWSVLHSSAPSTWGGGIPFKSLLQYETRRIHPQGTLCSWINHEYPSSFCNLNHYVSDFFLARLTTQPTFLGMPFNPKPMQCFALPSPQGFFSWLNLAGWLLFLIQKWLKSFFFFFFCGFLVTKFYFFIFFIFLQIFYIFLSFFYWVLACRQKCVIYKTYNQIFMNILYQVVNFPCIVMLLIPISLTIGNMTQECKNARMI